MLPYEQRFTRFCWKSLTLARWEQRPQLPPPPPQLPPLQLVASEESGLSSYSHPPATMNSFAFATLSTTLVSRGETRRRLFEMPGICLSPKKNYMLFHRCLPFESQWKIAENSGVKTLWSIPALAVVARRANSHFRKCSGIFGTT